MRLENESIHIIHYNGKIPFVIITPHCGYSTVYKTDFVIRDKTKLTSEILKKKPLNIGEIEEIWPGEDNVSAEWDGNTCILRLKDDKSYLYVSRNISRFNLQEGDEILKYKSPIGPNDVPYPYIQGKINTYLMMDDVYISNKDLTNELQIHKYEDEFYPYDFYYANQSNIQFKHFENKVIYKTNVKKEIMQMNK